MIEPPMDQSILRDKTVTLVFEGQAEQFYDVMLGYMISNNIISYPYKWTPSPNKKAFILEIVGGSPNHRPVILFPSPLPRFRSQLHFQIPEYNYDEYYKICNLLVDYLKNLGWIEKDNPQENSFPISKGASPISTLPKSEYGGELKRTPQTNNGETKRIEEKYVEIPSSNSEEFTERSPSEKLRDITANELVNCEFIYDVDNMKILSGYVSYDYNVMREIIWQVPKKYAEYQSSNSGRWGPCFIKVKSLKAPTISRYLGALYKMGVRTINGAPIPYTPRKID